MKNRHLNIFEHYSQKDTLPIENSNTRNLGIVLNSDKLCLDRFLDLVSKKCKEQKSTIVIEKPKNEDDFFIDIQVAIKELAERGLVIENLIGATLTTQESIFEEESTIKPDKNNITDKEWTKSYFR